jgi:hypothetical protein
LAYLITLFEVSVPSKPQHRTTKIDELTGLVFRNQRQVAGMYR